MRIKRYLPLFIAVYFIAASCLYSAFEDTGCGARIISMGNAFVGLSEGIYSIYYNPGGLVSLDNPEISFEYAKLYDGLDDNSNIGKGYFSFGLPIKKTPVRMGLGMSYQNLNLVGTYSEEIIKIGYGVKPVNWLSLGISAKILGQKYLIDGNQYYADDYLFDNGSNVQTFDLDFGILLSIVRSFSAGINIENLSQAEYGLDESNYLRLPRSTKLGFAYHEPEMNLVFDVQHRLYSGKKEDMRMGIGFEKWLIEQSKDRYLLALRLGFGTDISHVINQPNRNSRNVTFGFGANFNFIEFDYGFVFPVSGIEETNGTHFISVVSKFGKQTAVKTKKVSKVTVQPPPVEKIEVSSPTVSVQEVIVSTAVGQPAVPVEEIIVSTPSVPVAEITVSTPPVPVAEIIVSTPSVSAEEVTVSTPPVEGKAEVPEIEEPIEIKKPEVVKPEKPAVPIGPKTHKVSAGDTLESLANKYYGDRSKWHKIYNANQSNIERGILKPGQVLTIP